MVRANPVGRGITYHLAVLVDIERYAEEKAGKRAQVGHFAISPPESVGLPGGDRREADHFAAAVHAASCATRATKSAEVGDRVG